MYRKRIEEIRIGVALDSTAVCCIAQNNQANVALYEI